MNDYNQIMYKLDLADERLTLPVAIYQIEQGETVRFGSQTSTKSKELGKARVAFFALDRARTGSLPVYAYGDSDSCRLQAGTAPARVGNDEPSIVFHALPVESSPSVGKPGGDDRASTIGLNGNTGAHGKTVLLHEFVHKDGRRRYYATEHAPINDEYRRIGAICRVWPNPYPAHRNWRD